MGREKDRKLNRKRRRRAKLRKLKTRLVQTRDPKERERLIRMIYQTSMHKPVDIPAE